MKKTQDHSELPSQLEVRVYSSDTNQFGFFATLRNIIREFPLAHALGLRFAKRSISTKYRQSFLGIIWAFLPPLVTAGIWTFLNATKVVKLDDVGAPYPVFVITGIMLWTVFANAINIPLQVMQTNRNILVKINFPRESLIVNAFYEVLFSTAVTFIIIIVAMIAFKVPVGVDSLLFFPGVFLLMLLGLSIGLVLLPFSLLFKDLQMLVPLVLQLAMFLSPVFYATQPTSLKGMAAILKLNPVSPILSQTRGFLLHIPTDVSLMQIGSVAGTSVVLLVIGIYFQRITMQTLIERMGT